VFFSFLLNITNLLGNLLQRVFVSAVLHLEVCRKEKSEGGFSNVLGGF
jgi:hypothetical protein